jgi:hypothetical protein
MRRNWVPLVVTTALSVVGALLLLSSRAGALEQRVTALEQRQTAIDRTAPVRTDGKASRTRNAVPCYDN